MLARSIGLGLMSCLPAAPAFGQAAAATPQVRAELVPEAAAVRPGASFTVVLRLTIAPGWHIYAPDPGDLGLPTRVVWTLPEGLTVRRVEWPDPELAEEAPWTLRVYRGEVVVRARLRAAESSALGDTVAIGAQIRWGACRDVCVPQEVALSVARPVRSRP